MPVAYETPAPIGAIASASQAMARRQAQVAAAARAGGGGGGGVGGGIPYDTGIQDAISGRDRLQFAQQAHTDEVQQRYQLAQFGHDSAMVQQQGRFELQAQLHDVELSQTERMRLQRLNNALGMVAADPNLSEQDKADYVSQIKYDIDPLKRRLAQEKLQQEKMVKESIAEQKTFQAAHEKQRLDIMAKTGADRHVFIPDTQALSQIADDISKNLPGGMILSNEEISKMAHQEAINQNLGSSFIIQPDGKLEAVKPEGGAGAAGKGKGSADHPLGITTEDFNKMYADVVSHIDKRLSTKKKTDIGGEEFAFPQDPETRKRMISDELDARRQALEEFTKQSTAKPKGYQSRFKPKEKPQGMAAAAAPDAPPGGGAPAPVPIAALDDDAGRIQKSSAITDDEKLAAQFMLRKAKEIAKKYPDMTSKDVPDEVKKELKAIGENYEKIISKVKKEAPPNALGSFTGRPESSGQTVNPAPTVEDTRGWWTKLNAGDIGRSTLDIPQQLGRLGVPGVGRR